MIEIESTNLEENLTGPFIPKSIRPDSAKSSSLAAIPVNQFNVEQALRKFDAATEGYETSLPKLPVESTLSRTTPSFNDLVSNGYLLLRHGEKNEAQFLFAGALAIHSNHPGALKGLYKSVCENQNMIPSCVNILKTLCRIEPSFENFVLLGEVFEKSDATGEALTAYEKALELQVDDSPRVFDVFKNLGNIKLKHGDVEGAEEFYHKAYAMNSESVALMINLGTLEIQRKQFERAKQRYQKAIQLDSKNSRAWAGLGISHFYLNDHELAMSAMENAIEFDGQNKVPVQLFTRWCVDINQSQRAIPGLIKFLEVSNFDEDISNLFIQVALNLKMYDLALLEAEKGLLYSPYREDLLNLIKEIETRQLKSFESGE